MDRLIRNMGENVNDRYGFDPEGAVVPALCELLHKTASKVGPPASLLTRHLPLHLAQARVTIDKNLSRPAWTPLTVSAILLFRYLSNLGLL